MPAVASLTPVRKIGLLLLGKLFGSFIGRHAAGQGQFEVELKFKISKEDAIHLREVLPANGFDYTTTVLMSDTFLPTGEAGEIMRVRQEQDSQGERRSIFTSKQWVKTRTGRTRKEAESQAASTIALVFIVVGRMLNGKALLGFAKKRELFAGRLDGKQLVVSIDEVSGLGDFSGWYMEAEVLLPLDCDPSDFEQPILEQAQKLLGDSRLPVKQSYREMLLESYRLAGIA